MDIQNELTIFNLNIVNEFDQCLMDTILILYSSGCASIMSLVSIAVERYLVVVRPFNISNLNFKYAAGFIGKNETFEIVLNYIIHDIKAINFLCILLS